MTPQEIDRIESTIRHIQTAVDVDQWAMEIVVQALEKQIPKKPKVLIDTWLYPTYAEKVEYQTMLGGNALYHGCYGLMKR